MTNLLHFTTLDIQAVYLAVKQGKSLLGISKRLGHKSIRITADEYSILFEDVDQDIAMAFNELEELTETYSSVDHIKDVSPQEEADKHCISQNS